MVESGHETGIPGSRQSDLKKSFKSALRSLLTACSRQGLFKRLILGNRTTSVDKFFDSFMNRGFSIDLGSSYFRFDDCVSGSVISEDETIKPELKSLQDVLDIFSKFSGAEQKLLYRLYTQVIVNLHQTIEDEFDAQCQDFQVGPILDKVEQLVEEQSLDPLFSDKTNVMDIANDLTTAKKSEIRKLTGLLQRAEEQNRQMEDRISMLREQPQEVSGTANAIEKLKTGILGYFEGNDKLPPI